MGCTGASLRKLLGAAVSSSNKIHFQLFCTCRWINALLHSRLLSFSDFEGLQSVIFPGMWQCLASMVLFSIGIRALPAKRMVWNRPVHFPANMETVICTVYCKFYRLLRIVSFWLVFRQLSTCRLVLTIFMSNVDLGVIVVQLWAADTIIIALVVLPAWRTLYLLLRHGYWANISSGAVNIREVLSLKDFFQFCPG